jgi:tetratricopeptide (TPR) repeat protein
MHPDDPRDMTILDYWEREKRGELSAVARVDLGTMLADRGYPKDAVRMYRKALKDDNKLYEAWFRIGLVSHRQGEYDDARHAYKKCLKGLIGHGWCNFYIGLLEEQTAHPTKAMEYYRRAFEVAPELADPAVNPEVLYSRLKIGPELLLQGKGRFADSTPLTFLEPDRVAAVQSVYEPTPTPRPTAETETAAPAAAATGDAGATAAATAETEPRTEQPNRGRRRARPAVSPTPTLDIDEKKLDNMPFGTRLRGTLPTGTPTEE